LRDPESRSTWNSIGNSLSCTTHSARGDASVLEGVRRCSSAHFEREEAFLAGSDHPALEEHRARHREFTRQLARFEDARSREGVTRRLAMEIGNWLACWIREHQRYDLQLATHVREASRDGPGKAAP
jgi:hemerythrin-like metal-binding protein